MPIVLVNYADYDNMPGSPSMFKDELADIRKKHLLTTNKDSCNTKSIRKEHGRMEKN